MFADPDQAKDHSQTPHVWWFYRLPNDLPSDLAFFKCPSINPESPPYNGLLFRPQPFVFLVIVRQIRNYEPTEDCVAHGDCTFNDEDPFPAITLGIGSYLRQAICQDVGEGRAETSHQEIHRGSVQNLAHNPVVMHPF